MAWYSTGSVAVSNGSDLVTGTGTNWFSVLQIGWGFVGPDGRVYEIASVDNATQIRLTSNYQGATASAQSYSCFPTMSLAADLTAQLQTLISGYQAVKDGAGAGLFPLDDLIAFAGDPDTGLRRPASNKVALVAGGDDQLLLSAGEASGTAVQSAADDGSDGKLLKIHGSTGAFGLGGVGVSTSDADALVDSGFYTYDASALNTPTNNGTIVHIGRTASIHTQIAVSRNASNLARAFVRANDGNGWSDWFEVYTQNTVVGTVSEVGGVPTGAVIERGSNANGEYVKFADGTLIGSREVAVDVTSALTQQFAWAVSFVNDPSVSINHLATSPNAALFLSNIRSLNPSMTDFQLRLIAGGTSTDPASDGEKLSCVGIGRWF